MLAMMVSFTVIVAVVVMGIATYLLNRFNQS
jgi:hypothetical protein